jgi:predicted ATPase/class 3 adenylate cyclase/DNA-binding CsgD family transcriptional regulator
MARLPEGTTTFMLTDLQGSTQAWEKHPKAMRSIMARHDEILASTVRVHKGELVEAGREGDSILAVFRTAATAAACALDVQKVFAAESWPEELELKVRVALHTGEAQLREGHYFGAALNRCARLLAICHPGQILLTKATEALLVDEVPAGGELQDLGLHRLKDLARPEQVFQLSDLARPLDFSRIQSQPQQQTNMPNYLTNFVGRAVELTALQSVLSTSRMVTLTGAGGSGKTRLAAELGRACLDLWPGGVWWVELAPVSDPRQVPGAVVTALELPGRGPALNVAVSWLAPRRAVLILDNCEHLVAACAEFCHATLQRCPELTFIATSREALGVPGEARWPVLSMHAADAIQLFEARARLVLSDFRVTASNLETIAQICERLDGMPLAIELAAARLGTLTEQEILSQLSDRFHLLAGGDRTAPERQQTMMATIDWSYWLLSEAEARLFRRLAVFRGGFTLVSVDAVCADEIGGNVLDLVDGLVRKSMVVAERPEGSVSRYRLLESQLVYAEDRLREANELEPLRRRHYEYFRDRLKAEDPWVLEPPPGIARRQWTAHESANLWAALEWARNNADDLGIGLAVVFAGDFGSRDLTQLRRLLDDVLAQSTAGAALRVKALTVAASLAWSQGDTKAALWASESAVSLARELGDLQPLALALNQLGMAHQFVGALDAAAAAYEEASTYVKGSDNRAWVVVRNSLGILAVHRGDYGAALEILVECVAEARAHGDMWLYSGFLDSLAYAQLGLNKLDAAARSWKEALPICGDFGDDFGIAHGFRGLACVASLLGDDVRALRLAAAANRTTTTGSLGTDAWLQRQVEEAERRSRSRLGTRNSDEAWKAGWEMTVDQAIEFALGEGPSDTLVDAGPLSRRQREVATLVAAGMTNREIAERLFIAERSAEGHVERIRNKLGVRSRTEVATWAVEHGLTAPQIIERGTRDGPLPTRRGQPT